MEQSLIKLSQEAQIPVVNQLGRAFLIYMNTKRREP